MKNFPEIWARYYNILNLTQISPPVFAVQNCKLTCKRQLDVNAELLFGLSGLKKPPTFRFQYYVYI